MIVLDPLHYAGQPQSDYPRNVNRGSSREKYVSALTAHASDMEGDLVVQVVVAIFRKKIQHMTPTLCAKSRAGKEKPKTKPEKKMRRVEYK